MRIVFFCHSVLSDWNHGNAHFLRGVASELVRRGHRVTLCEPAEAWSFASLVADEGPDASADLFRYYPELEGRVRVYHPVHPDLPRLLDGADLVLVHERNDPALVAAVGRQRRLMDFRLLFHDTHHRCVTDPAAMAAFDLRDYDGVLAFGEVIRRIYLERRWCRQAWTWHEAADTHVFRPRGPGPELARAHDADPQTGGAPGDLVWIGNWGDGERSRELAAYLLDPVARLHLRAEVWGVRYPRQARDALGEAGIGYRGWLPNYRAPEVFARHRVTVHVPRGPYAARLPGIPTIRPFEALACGIPLISAPWDDCEGLSREGRDYLRARNGRQMTELLRAVLSEPGLARSLSESGRETIRARHTCAHRVDELLAVHRDLADAGGGPRHTEGAPS